MHMWELFLLTKAAGTQHCRRGSRQLMGTVSLPSPACEGLCRGAKGEWGFPAQMESWEDLASIYALWKKTYT